MSIMNKKRWAGVGAVLLTVSALSACGSDDDSDDSASGGSEGSGDPCGGESISIPIAAGWDEDIVTTYLWKSVLEEKGCEVEVKEMDIGVVFQGLASGDQDLFLDTWTPNTHASYLEQFGDDMEEIGTWYDEASLTLTVPEYMDVESIEDLPDIADDLDGTITGIDPGAGLTKAVKEKVIPDYGLDEDFELNISSTATMLTELEAAVKNEEPIVVTLWHPHRAYEQWDLKDLKDPEGSLGEPEEIKTFARSGFSDDFPEIAEAVGNWTMDNETLMSLEKAGLLDSKDPEAGVQKWIEDNQDYVNEMMP